MLRFFGLILTADEESMEITTKTKSKKKPKKKKKKVVNFKQLWHFFLSAAACLQVICTIQFLAKLFRHIRAKWGCEDFFANKFLSFTNEVSE